MLGAGQWDEVDVLQLFLMVDVEAGVGQDVAVCPGPPLDLPVQRRDGLLERCGPVFHFLLEEAVDHSRVGLSRPVSVPTIDSSSLYWSVSTR
jgi:hypothetical protein